MCAAIPCNKKRDAADTDIERSTGSFNLATNGLPQQALVLAPVASAPAVPCATAPPLRSQSRSRSSAGSHTTEVAVVEEDNWFLREFTCKNSVTMLQYPWETPTWTCEICTANWCLTKGHPSRLPQTFTCMGSVLHSSKVNYRECFECNAQWIAQ